VEPTEHTIRIPQFFVTCGVDCFGEYVISWSDQQVFIAIVRFGSVVDEVSEIVRIEFVKN